MQNPAIAIDTPLKLNLGCGNKTFVGYVNLDLPTNTAADSHWDLRTTPWPFATDSVEDVRAFDVMEHLPDPVAFMTELLRVCRPGAKIHITTPHVSCLNAFKDPTHLKAFTLGTFDHFSSSSFAPGPKRLAIASRKLFFYPSLVNKILWRLANRFPDAYERRWAWIFPGWFMEIQLKVESK